MVPSEARDHIEWASKRFTNILSTWFTREIKILCVSIYFMNYVLFLIIICKDLEIPVIMITKSCPMAILSVSAREVSTIQNLHWY